MGYACRLNGVIGYGVTPQAAFKARAARAAAVAARKSRAVADHQEESRLRQLVDVLKRDVQALLMEKYKWTPDETVQRKYERVVAQFDWLIRELKAREDGLPPEIFGRLSLHEWAMQVRRDEFEDRPPTAGPRP